MSIVLPRSIQRLTRLDFLDGLGIAIAETSVSLVHLRKRLMAVSLLAHRRVELPEAGDERRQALSAAVRAFVSETEAPTDRAYISLPRSLALSTRLSVPVAARADLEQVVDFELERLLPLARDEVFFDYLVREKGDKLDLRILALPRTTVNDLLATFELAGLRPRSLVVTPVALADALAFAGEDAEAPLALVVHGGGRGEIDLFQNEALLASSVFTAGELAGAEQAQQRARGEAAAAGLPSDGLRVVELGGGADAPAAESRVEATKLLDAVLGNMTVAESARDGIEPALLPALGVGLSAVRESSLSLNMLPAEERGGSEEGAPVVTFFLASVLALVTTVWLLGAMVQDFRIERHLKSELVALEPQLRQVRAEEAESRDLADKIRLLARGEQALATFYLQELTEIVPKDAYLNTFRMRNGKIELEGFAKEASELIPAIDKSRHFSNPQFTSPVTKVQNNEERFSLSTKVAE
ncbi:MAG: PilN domain-containing protein [Deltaproteobacteria bacterium]